MGDELMGKAQSSGASPGWLNANPNSRVCSPIGAGPASSWDCPQAGKLDMIWDKAALGRQQSARWLSMRALGPG